MPNIWIHNADEIGVLECVDCIYDSKYLWRLQNNDIFFLRCSIDAFYLNYIKRVKGLNEDCKICSINRLKNESTLVESILCNQKILLELYLLNKSNSYEFNPYFQSKAIHDLFKSTGIDMKFTSYDLVNVGLIKQLNSKTFFKKLCNQAEVDCVPPQKGFVSSDFDEICSLIDRVAGMNNDKVFLKKAFSGGGHGNKGGTSSYLKKYLSAWLSPGEEVMVEYLCDFDVIVGSLIDIKEDSINFIGLDKQIINDFKWYGLTYPYEDNQEGEIVRSNSMKLAEVIYRTGARGPLNLDFGIIKNNNIPIVYALEANFRDNGFGLLLEVLSDRNKCLHYNHRYSLSNYANFDDIYDKIKSITLNQESILISDTKKKNGVIIVDINMSVKTFGLAIVGSNFNEISEIKKLVNENFNICELTK